MPRFLIPKRSGPHRIACIALYRAILSHCPQLPIPDERRLALRKQVKKSFWRNRNVHSHRLVILALKAGYEAEELFRLSADGDASSTSRILNLLSEVSPARSKEPTGDILHSQVSSSPKKPPPKPHRTPAPFPGATPVLSRPYPKISGRRQVPRLVNANSNPFLRFKKPQSPFLTRVLRNKIEQKHRRFDLLAEMNETMATAQHEDHWDQILERELQVDAGEERESWTTEIRYSLWLIDQQLKQEERKKIALSKRMVEIVEQEQRMADAERAELREERRLARKARRIAERAREEGELGPA